MENSKLKFLWDASRILKMKDQSLALRNVINQMSQQYLKTVVAGSHSEKDISCEVCKCCGNAWVDGLFTLNFLGHNLHMKKHKIKSENKSELSISRKRFLSFYKKRKDNILVKKCLICNTLNKRGMSKPHLKLGEYASLDCSLKSVENQMSLKRKRKRKSKKQSFAGLSPAAVLQTRLSTHVIGSDKPGSKIPNINNDGNNVNLRSNISFLPAPEISSSNNLKCNVSLDTYKNKTKDQKLINTDKQLSTIKKKSKKKKKSYVGEFLSLL